MITGLSYGFHDAAKTIIDLNGNIIYAGHAERYSRIKNDKNLHPDMPPNQGVEVFYEKQILKNTRRLYAGQKIKWRGRHKSISHHWSHAAGAYYTRPWPEEPVCVVVDAIGEWDTVSIWYKKKKVWSQKYPYSLGLFYSAITQRIGLKPMEDEYITMGMAAFGEPVYNLEDVLQVNLHKGCGNIFPNARNEDLAASAQWLLEQKIIQIMQKAREYSKYLCYAGGVALNCVVNSKIHWLFDKVWIMPNPGDAGASLGAAAAYLDKPLKWKDPYLGKNVDVSANPREIAGHLLQHRICGVVHGRAEFGPRALGNRSLLADPRHDIKNTVNAIKRRQKFRPFAPAILEEYSEQFFEGPMNEYMQYVAKANHDYKSVIHVDGSSRVQVVRKDCKSILRPILEEWFKATRCPMLLNTSLNVKGEPMVNTWEDGQRWSKKYEVAVY